MPVEIIQFKALKTSIIVGLDYIATEFIARINPEKSWAHQNTVVNNKRQARNYKTKQVRNWILKIKQQLTTLITD